MHVHTMLYLICNKLPEGERDNKSLTLFEVLIHCRHDFGSTVPSLKRAVQRWLHLSEIKQKNISDGHGETLEEKEIIS